MPGLTIEHVALQENQINATPQAQYNLANSSSYRQLRVFHNGTCACAFADI
jgi:hypothetical protein